MRPRRYLSDITEQTCFRKNVAPRLHVYAAALEGANQGIDALSLDEPQGNLERRNGRVAQLGQLFSSTQPF